MYQVRLGHFQQYFSYIVAVSFIGGGNRSTRRKPLTCRKSFDLFMVYISECKQQLIKNYEIIHAENPQILQTLNLGRSFITLGEPFMATYYKYT